MVNWEKIIQRYYESLSLRIEWVRMDPRTLFLLAWKGKRVQIVFVDLRNVIRKRSAYEVREAFLVLLSYLRKQPSWERIFKGRDVSFKWLILKDPSESVRKVLRQAGVEPFLFLRFWEGEDPMEG